MLANAPVSFGVWGPHTGLPGVTGRDVLATVAGSGYQGSELGPAGYLGSVDETAEAYLEHGLQAAGIYVGLHLRHADGLSAAARDGLVDVCHRVLAVQQLAKQSGAPQGALPLGPIVLADEGHTTLRDNPARDSGDRRLALDDDTWRHAVRTIAAAQEIVASHGLRTSFHPHLATFVEARWEVERLLATTTVGLTLDTGHLLLAGAEPVQCLQDWGDRVDHVHLKDVRLDVLAGSRQDGRGRIDHWWGAACVPFGRGDVNLSGVLATLTDQSYRGWIVVEQDHTPSGTDDLDILLDEQRANRDWLASTLSELHAR